MSTMDETYEGIAEPERIQREFAEYMGTKPKPGLMGPMEQWEFAEYMGTKPEPGLMGPMEQWANDRALLAQTAAFNIPIRAIVANDEFWKFAREQDARYAALTAYKKAWDYAVATFNNMLAERHADTDIVAVLDKIFDEWGAKLEAREVTP